MRVAVRKVYEWDHDHHHWTEFDRALIARGNRVVVVALEAGLDDLTAP